jgi:hypothetical protein
MQDPLSDQPILRFVDRQVKEQGYLKVITAPMVALAAIGGVLLLLGNNWLAFGTVVGGGTCVLALLLLAIEHMHTSKLQKEVSDLEGKLSSIDEDVKQGVAISERHSAEIKNLQESLQGIRWITDRMAACCSTTTNGAKQRRSPVGAEDICRIPHFADLEEVVLDYISEILGRSARRLVIYYGDETRLEPAHKRGWPKTNPRILIAGQPKKPLEVNATTLLDALKGRPEVYVPDLTHPNEEQKPFIDVVPDHQDYRTLACFRLASLPSVRVESTERATLLGAILVQDVRANALGDMFEGQFEHQFLIVLANALATAFLGVRLGLTRSGQN